MCVKIDLKHQSQLQNKLDTREKTHAHTNKSGNLRIEKPTNLRGGHIIREGAVWLRRINRILMTKITMCVKMISIRVRVKRDTSGT